jgi:hypothetical protein
MLTDTELNLLQSALRIAIDRWIADAEAMREEYAACGDPAFTSLERQFDRQADQANALSEKLDAMLGV